MEQKLMIVIAATLLILVYQYFRAFFFLSFFYFLPFCLGISQYIASSWLVCDFTSLTEEAVLR